MVASGRSYGGFWTYQLAARYPHEFGAFQPTVPVADPALFYQKHGWMPYDFKRLPVRTPMNMMAAIENEDERVTPDQGRLGFATLTNRLGPSAKAYMVTVPGGHGSKAELIHTLSWLAHLYGVTELKPLT